MKNLAKLRKLMLENGMLRSQGNSAASFEIIPFGEELFDPGGEMRGLGPGGDPTPEGGGCTTCGSGCQPACQPGCKAGCVDGCDECCSDGTL